MSGAHLAKPLLVTSARGRAALQVGMGRLPPPTLALPQSAEATLLKRDQLQPPNGLQCLPLSRPPERSTCGRVVEPAAPTRTSPSRPSSTWDFARASHLSSGPFPLPWVRARARPPLRSSGRPQGADPGCYCQESPLDRVDKIAS